MVMADDHMSTFHCNGSNNLKEQFLNVSLNVLLNKNGHMTGKVENSKFSSEEYFFLFNHASFLHIYHSSIFLAQLQIA